MDKRFILSWITLLFVGAFLTLYVYSLSPNLSISDTSASDSITYEGTVCRTITGADGVVKSYECNHNVLFNNGAEIVKQILGGGANMGAITNISLCNATAPGTGCGDPSAAATEDFTLLNSDGFEPAAGTYATNPGTGNWSVYHTFTATVDNTVINVTRLQNSSGGLFAGNSFTAATLQSSDQITINWTISVA